MINLESDEQSGYQDMIKLPECISSKMSELELINFTFPNLNSKSVLIMLIVSLLIIFNYFINY